MNRKDRDRLKLLRWFKQETGQLDVSMREVAKWAHERKGYALPKPIDPYDVFARQLSRAARQEVRHDETTGRPYRANHAFTESIGGEQLTLWFDIDEKPLRRKMHKSLIQRREQMVGEAVQFTLDQAHWNHTNPDQEPIRLPMDLADDVEWRLNAPDEEEQQVG